MAVDAPQDVLQHVDPDLVVELATELCRVPTPLGDEGKLAPYVLAQLERLGFEAELQEVVPDRPNVIGISRGSPRYRSFMLNGHLDMPMPFGQWRHDPFDPWIENGVLYGAGIQDMKGGVAALIAGAAAVVKAGLRDRGDVILTAVMHHDTTGLGTKYFLEACPWRIDAGINGEPTNLAVQLFHGGAWGFEIRTRGIPRHHVQLSEGVSAIDGMLRILQQLTREALTFTPDPRHPELPSVVAGRIWGGEYNTMTAEECVARGDIRWLPSMSIDGMKADIQRIIDRVCAEMPGLSGKVTTYRQQWPYEVSEDNWVVQTVIRAHTRVTGAPPVVKSGLPMSCAITDTADMVRHGIPSALYGPADWRTEPNEGIPIQDLVTAARVYALTCAEIVTQPREEPARGQGGER